MRRALVITFSVAVYTALFFGLALCFMAWNLVRVYLDVGDFGVARAVIADEPYMTLPIACLGAIVGFVAGLFADA